MKSLHIGNEMAAFPLSWSAAEVIRALMERDEGHSPPLCSELWEDPYVVSHLGSSWRPSQQPRECQAWEAWETACPAFCFLVGVAPCHPRMKGWGSFCSSSHSPRGCVVQDTGRLSTFSSSPTSFTRQSFYQNFLPPFQS